MTDQMSGKKGGKRTPKESSKKSSSRGKKRKSDTEGSEQNESRLVKKEENLKSPVGTGSPVKKKNKLSLKGKDSILSKKSTPIKNESAENQSKGDGESETAQKQQNTPCVASLHNLGNTCYLNSVLQVLRYTPGFVEDIEQLSQEVMISRKERSWQEEQEEDVLTWSIVTHLKQTFEKMVNREKDFKDGKSPYVGVRPYDLLDTIEQLNPMFSGGEQHDAHEVLGCLLAYIQDATAEINKHRNNNKHRLNGNLPQLPHKVEKSEDTEEEEVNEVTHLVDDGEMDNVEVTKSDNARSVTSEASDKHSQDITASGDGNTVVTHAIIESPMKSQYPVEAKVCGLNPCDQLDGVCDTKSPETQPAQKSPRKSRMKKVNDENAVKGDVNILPNENQVIGKSQDKTNGVSPTLKSNVKSPIQGQTTITSMFQSAGIKRYGVSRNVVKGNATSPQSDCDEAKESHRAPFKPPTPCKLGGTCLRSPKNSAVSRLHMVSPFSCRHETKSTDASPESDMQVCEPQNGCLEEDVKSQPMETNESVSEDTPVELTNGTHSIENDCEMTSTSNGPEMLETDVTSKEDVKTAHVDFTSPENKPIPEKCVKKIDSLSKEPTTPELKAEALSRGKSANVKLQRLKMTSFFTKVAKTVEKAPELKVDKINDCIAEKCMGKVALRTQCLTCESSTERKEVFQDISIPVRKEKSKCSESDVEDEEDKENVSPCQWLYDAVSETEMLADDNKYFCDSCRHLVEAQRSVNYVSMPAVLTLHLKRFAALSGFFGGFTKINDHIHVPYNLPCFRDECRNKPCKKQTHRYSLYAMITHTGVSLSSGHYVAYVKAPIGARPNLPNNQPPPAAKALTFADKPSPNPPAIKLFSKPKSTTKPAANARRIPLTTLETKPKNIFERLGMKDTDADTKSTGECSSKLGDAVAASMPASPVKAEPFTPTDSPLMGGPDMTSSSLVCTEEDPLWYECDDEYVTVMSQTDIDKLLSPSGSTPYLLFYRQCTTAEY